MLPSILSEKQEQEHPFFAREHVKLHLCEIQPSDVKAEVSFILSL